MTLPVRKLHSTQLEYRSDSEKALIGRQMGGGIALASVIQY